MKRSFPALLTVLVLMTLAGCASPALRKETPLLFPQAPSTPRLAYIQSLYGAADFQTVTFFDRILGFSLQRSFGKPFDVYARDDKVYLTDGEKRVVFVVDLKERRVGLLGATGAGRLSQPMGITGSPDGRVYVTDLQQKTVMVYAENGDFLQSIGTPGEMDNPVGVAVNQTLQRVYVADSKAHTILVYSTKGDFLFQFGGLGSADGQLAFPAFITIDRRNDQVYVSDTNNFRIQVFDQDGRFLRKYGELGDAPGYFQRPKGVALDSDGNSYVVEGHFNNFQIFNDQGQVLTWVGWGGSGAGALFLAPAGLYIDEDDRIFIADAINKRVQVFQYFSERWKKEHPDEFRRLVGSSAGAAAP